MFMTLFHGFFYLETLSTKHLTLRQLKMKDAQDIFLYSKDEEVARHVLWEAQKSISEAKDYIRYMNRRYRNNEPSSWGIIDNYSNHLIGTIGYMNYDENNGSTEIGYSLSRKYWNQGIMTEALTKVIDYTFKNMQVERIEAQHETDNPASGRVMEKCGMKKEGILRHRLYNKGKYVDMVVYSILKSEYSPS